LIRRFSPPILGLQFLVDLLLTLIAVKGAEQVRIHLLTGLEQRADLSQYFAIRPSVYILIFSIWIVFFVLFGAFNSRRRDTLLVDLWQLLLSITVSILVLASTFYLLALQPPVAPSRLFYVYFYILDLVLLVSAHVVAYRIVASLRRHGRNLRRVLLVGSGVQGRHVAVRLQEQETTGLALAGYLSPATEAPLGELRRLGGFEGLLTVVHEREIDEVIIALPASAHMDVLKMHSSLQETDVNVRILPDVFEMVAMRARVDDFYGLPLISLREPSMNPAQAGVKRAFDLIIAGVLSILTLPLVLIIAIWIRLDSPGPIIIHQPRVGAKGTIFSMHKFRSMRWEPEDLHVAVGKRRGDPRVTRAGLLLRRTSLDEIPQLWNVLRGEMSLVGPRPELPAIVEQYEPWQYKRFNVPPGMTGWWQVNGRGDRSMHTNTEIDLFYVQNYSILLDIQILLRRLGAVVRGKGAF
jgi:exopolysaccharide biosynthesis polyprenyl glycosylphosphotransferase